MNEKARVLIVESKREMNKLRACFDDDDYVVGMAHSPGEAVDRMTKNQWDLALVSNDLSESAEPDVEVRLRNIDPKMAIMTVLNYGPGLAADALKYGAYDFVTKPIDQIEVENRVGNAIRHQRADRESIRLRALLVEEDGKSLEEVERAHILRILEECKGNRSRAAAILCIDRTTLYQKLREYLRHRRS